MPATVSRVIDGDTFKIREQEASIRLWGIDAPERDDVPAGPEATAYLQSLMETSDCMLFCFVEDVDHYGRDVARCTLDDGRDLQETMIEAGHAVEWCRYSKNAYGQCEAPGGRRRD